MTDEQFDIDQEIQMQICEVADQILEQLGKQCGHDPHVGIAALAVAMCSLARADGTPLSQIEKVVSIAHEQVAAHYYGDTYGNAP